MIGAGFLRNIFERRTLLYQLVRRDYEQRFVGSSAGWLWGMIHPMVMIASWTIVFQFFMKSANPDPARLGACTVWHRGELSRWLRAGAPDRATWNAMKAADAARKGGRR